MLIALLLVIMVAPSIAQDDTGWPVIQNCVTPLESRPDTFGGAILLTGQFGIHAISGAFDTPYVVAFLSENLSLGGAGLSPNGLWYADMIGENQTDGTTRTWHIQAINIHSTGIDTDIMTVDRDYTYLFSITDYRSEVHMRWLNNEDLIFAGSNRVSRVRDNEPIIINFRTREVKTWEGELNPLINSVDLRPSPDWTRALFNTSENPFDPEIWGLYDPMTGELVADVHLADVSHTAWSHDSAYFVAETNAGDDFEPDYRLTLFDRDGGVMGTVFDFPEGERILSVFDDHTQHLVWSPDGRYLAFVTTGLSYPTIITLYIVDMEEGIITNTCLETTDGLAWSPDSTQLAFMARLDYDPHRPVLIYDTSTALAYTAAYHDGSVIGWREN